MLSPPWQPTTAEWQCPGLYAQAEGDPDLMLEIIPLKETRKFIRMVSKIYTLPPNYERPE